MGLWTYNGLVYIKTVDKPGNFRIIQVDGFTLSLLLKYMMAHKDHPATGLFRRIKQPKLGITDEWVAKRCLEVMKAAGINIQAFTAHSLRGASATHFLRCGMDRQAVQNRGGWSSALNMDIFTQSYAKNFRGI